MTKKCPDCNMAITSELFHTCSKHLLVSLPATYKKSLPCSYCGFVSGNEHDLLTHVELCEIKYKLKQQAIKAAAQKTIEPEQIARLEHKYNYRDKPATPSDEKVNHPSHYNSGKIEVIDFIDDQNLGFNLGNTVKYICRAKHKGRTLEDLKKAMWYLQHEIELVEKGGQ